MRRVGALLQKVHFAAHARRVHVLSQLFELYARSDTQIRHVARHRIGHQADMPLCALGRGRFRSRARQSQRRYEMAFLTGIAELLHNPSGLWEILILRVFDFIGNYGWRILFFTVCLKMLLLPLDIYQRVKMRKNQRITERLQPQIEKLQQQYAGDKQKLAQKQMELNRKEGFSYFSSCLPMIVTLVIFFYLFSGLNNISRYKNFKQYVELYDAYTAVELVEKDLARENGGRNGAHRFVEPTVRRATSGGRGGQRRFAQRSATRHARTIQQRDKAQGATSGRRPLRGNGRLQRQRRQRIVFVGEQYLVARRALAQGHTVLQPIQKQHNGLQVVRQGAQKTQSEHRNARRERASV